MPKPHRPPRRQLLLRLCGKGLPRPDRQAVGVLGNQGASVIAKSYEMKAAGVKTGEPGKRSSAPRHLRQT